MKNSHTPGPLEIRFDHRHNRADLYSNGLLIGEAFTGGSNKTTAERQAWARIARNDAAAPDLLAELKRTKEVLQEILVNAAKCNYVDSHGLGLAHLKERNVYLGRAIAKAEGRT